MNGMTRQKQQIEYFPNSNNHKKGRKEKINDCDEFDD